VNTSCGCPHAHLTSFRTVGSEKEDRISKVEAAASGKEESAPEMEEPANIITLLGKDGEKPYRNFGNTLKMQPASKLIPKHPVLYSNLSADDDNDPINQDQYDEAAAVTNGDSSSPSSRQWGGSSSDDDDLPLSARATATGGSSAAGKDHHATKNAQAPVPEKKKSSEQQDQKKKRINDELVDANDSDISNKKTRFAPVRKGGKCGTCENCLNPRWKKACIEVRKAQETAAAAATGNGNSGARAVKPPKPAVSAAAAKPVKKPTAAPAAAAPVTTAKPLSSEAFANSLGKLMASGGSIVQPSHVPILIDLMKRANTWGQRQSILSTMVKSIQDVLSEIVQQKGLLILQKWFSEAIEGKRAKSLSSLMTTLDAMPISVAALSSPCELGKLVGNLRKAPEELDALKPQAAALVKKWKAIVQRGDAIVSVPVEKAVTAAAAATAKAAAAAAETKAAASKAAATIDAVKQKTKLPSISLATASNITSSSKLGDDVDLFGAADKRRAGAAAVPKPKTDTVKVHSKPGTTNRKPMLAARKKAVDSSASQSTSSSLLPSVSVSSLSSLGGSTGGGGGGSTSSGAVFGPTSSSGGLSFGSHMPVMMTAADRARQRAKEAAARVPSPEPAPRKEKKKKLVWKDVNEIESIRWFRKADPPSAAKKDADDSAPPAAFEDTKEPSPPPQFASAAKKEHLSEAHALRAHRQEEDEFRANYIELLARMVPDIEWYSPPMIAAATAAAGGTTIATGEQSYEIAAARARRAGMHPGAPVPTYPVEANETDRGRPQPLQSIQRIPLSTEEAQLWAAQAQAKQQQREVEQQRREREQQRHALPPTQQGGYYNRSGGGGGPPPQRYAHPPAAVGAPAAAPAPAAASLPDGLSAALAQLTASRALPASNTNASAPPPHLQHHQPPPQAARRPQRQPQQQQRPPPRLQPRGPALPPGMRPMLGLHRPAQPSPVATTATEAVSPQLPTQHHIPPPVNNGIASGGRSRTPCRFYMSAEGCRAGNKCRFAHLPVDQAAKRPRVDGSHGGGAPPRAPGFGSIWD